MNGKITHIMNLLIATVCLMAICGGVVYRFYSLDKTGLIISFVLTAICLAAMQYFYIISSKKTRRKPSWAENKKQEKNHAPISRVWRIFFAASHLLSSAACFFILLKSRTDSAIISPWDVVPKYFFVFYCAAALLLICNAAANGKIALPFITLHYFLSFSIALSIYKLGYGYDPFVHQATEILIDKTGAVEPKQFYYLGQYGLIAMLRSLTSAPVVWIDRLLAPILAALFLPMAFWRACKFWFDSEKLSLTLVITALVLSFQFLIVTTPQNLAYLFLILTILLGLFCKNLYDFSIIALLAAAAALTHPVAGIPALLFAALLAVHHGDSGKIKKYAYAALFSAAIFVMPVLFYFLNNNLDPSGSSAGLAPSAKNFAFESAGSENFILNFVYLYGFNLKFILILLALAGIFIAWKHKERCKILWLYLAMSAALSASYMITAKLPFAFLINYEREDYPNRILLIACFFLLPFFMLAIYAMLKKISEQNFFVIAGFSIFSVLLAGASLYMSYPRHDNYFNSRGYSVSSADIEAVGWINENAKNDFIVLANQQVSAAALSKFGFKKYYADGKLFYYPIPTSSPLYQHYLDMVYKEPGRKTMLKAMDLADVGHAYFVLNKYWRGFSGIADQAKLSADAWLEIGRGEIYIFEYVKK